MTKRLARLIAQLLPKGGFLRGASVLAGGTALGQGLVLLASPVLTRLYSADDFGILAVFTALLGILTVIASLRYELAIPLPEDDGEAANALVLSLLVVVLASGISGVLVLLLAGPITSLTNTPGLRALLWLLPVGLLLTGSYQALNYWAVRKEAFTTIARTKLSQGAGSVLAQVGLGYLGASPLGLLAGQIVGRGAGVLTLASHAIRSPGVIQRGLRWRGILRIVVRYRRFPIYSTWTALANSVSMQAPALLLTTYFGTNVTGLYALGLRVLQTPMALVGSSVAQVFFSRAAMAKREGRLESLALSVFVALTRIGVPALGIVAIAAPELFGFAFGDSWREAGVYAQWFAPWLLFQFISSPLSTLPSLMEKQGLETAMLSGLLAGRLAALVVGGVAHDATLAIALYSAVSALGYLSFMYWNLSIVGIPPLESTGHFARATVGGLWLLAPTIIGKAATYFTHHGMFLITGATISVLLTGITLLRNIKHSRSM